MLLFATLPEVFYLPSPFLPPPAGRPKSPQSNWEPAKPVRTEGFDQPFLHSGSFHALLDVLPHDAKYNTIDKRFIFNHLAIAGPIVAVRLISDTHVHLSKPKGAAAERAQALEAALGLSLRDQLKDAAHILWRS